MAGYIMKTIAQMEDALIAAEEFLKIVLVYHRDGVVLPDAPLEVAEEFENALVIAGGKCSAALESYRIHKN